jgi:hypothetical protein
MNLPNAIERLRDVLRRQHKATGTEDWLAMGYLHAKGRRVRSPLESILGGNLQSNADPLTVQAAACAPLFPKSA